MPKSRGIQVLSKIAIESGDGANQYFRGSAVAESLVTLRWRHSVAPQHAHPMWSWRWSWC